MTQCGYHLIETISLFPIGQGISTSLKSEQTGPHCLITTAAPADSWYMDSQGNGGKDVFRKSSLLYLLTVDLRIRDGPGVQGALLKCSGAGDVDHTTCINAGLGSECQGAPSIFSFVKKQLIKKPSGPP